MADNEGSERPIIERRNPDGSTTRLQVEEDGSETILMSGHADFSEFAASAGEPPDKGE